MNRREAISSLIALGASPLPALGQAPERLRRVGVLRAAPDDGIFRANFAPFLPTLREGGFVEGRNLAVEYRVKPGRAEEILALANELARGQPDAILAIAAPAVLAAVKSTSSIPIVAVDLESDPVASNFARSLSRPGGNVTGLFLDFPELSGKWIQLLKEAMPKLGRAALLCDPATGTYLIKGAEAAAAAMQLQLVRVEAGNIAQLAAAFATASGAKAEAMLVLSSPVFNSARREIAALALKHRLPSIMPFPEFADDGGFMAYGPHVTSMFRQAAATMVKVLRGEPPQAIPIERPTRFELVVNLKTARVLGAGVPQALQVRADRVIE